ncbi:anti-sigma factor [Planotetraspora phitsanulokensis]|uniref:anti-sigma factor n=1 Tax=Planotetraspora phitsanulokensis TaxID=575192 RepID=UPI00194E5466|nr:anti-sigma factor [Planotetraspora phitsanulokensis]
MSVRGSDVHALAGAYALHAIDDDGELRLFEEHLSGCAECAQEVRGLAETATRLGLAAAVEPPPALRDRIMAEIGQVRQLPPLVAPSPSIRESRSSAERRSPLAGWLRWRPRLAAALTATAVAAAVLLGVVAVRTQAGLDELRATDREVTAVLAAPDVRSATAPSGAAGGTVVVSRSQGKMVFVASGLASLPDSRTYQLWQIGPEGARSAGLLRPDGTGHISPVVSATVDGATTVGVTVEPAGGSEQPTTQPLLLLDLPQA